MFDTQDFQDFGAGEFQSDAVQFRGDASTDAASLQNSAAPVQSSAAPMLTPHEQWSTQISVKPELPCNTQSVAEYLGVSYTTLKNRWVGEFLEVVEGLETPPIRNGKKLWTEFGFEQLVAYCLAVRINKSISYLDYQSSLTAKFPIKSELLEVEISEDETVPGALALRANTTLSTVEIPTFETNYQEFGFEDYSSELTIMSEQFGSFLDTGNAQTNALAQALIQKAAMEGMKLGQAVVQAKYGSMQQVIANADLQMGKAHGVIKSSDGQ